MAADYRASVYATAYAADPICSSPRVVKAVTSRFNWAERNTFRWGVQLGALANPRPNPTPVLDVGVIAKRYCMAEALMSDGTQSTAYYVVSFGQGFASLGNNVDSCVVGFDPWRVHDWACRTVR
jgi:hypothetical protein